VCVGVASVGFVASFAWFMAGWAQLWWMERPRLAATVAASAVLVALTILGWLTWSLARSRRARS
jgi:hypothetical protein